MAYTKEDLLSALEKVGSIEFTESEAEAMADLFAQDEVAGFAQRPRARGWQLEIEGVPQGFMVEISGVEAGFKLGFTLNEELL